MTDSTGLVMRTPYFLLATLFAAVLAGCGQKGPLYLRDNPPANVKPVKPDAYKPVPYPPGLPAEAEPGGVPAAK